MPTNYPAALDDNIVLKSDMQDGDGILASYDANQSDALKAIEAKLGITNSADPTSIDYQVRNNLGKSLQLAGATQSTRYVGARATAAPTGNTWQLGDWMILQNGGIAVCTVAGTPGTWVTISPLGVPVRSIADYVIYKSGSNFIAHNNATGVDDFSSTNAASVVQSAHDALGRAGIIELMRGVTYTATSMVTLSQAGVMVRSSPQSGEDVSTLWQVTSALSAGQGAFRVTGSGAAIGGISVDANGNADYGIDLRGGGQMCFDSNLKAAKVACFYVDGPAGAARCMFWNIRVDNGSDNGAINFKFDGPDHIGWGIRSTGSATNGYSLWMDTSRLQLSAGHITGTNDEAACVFISGDENRISDFYFDSGPNGTNGNAHTVIKGSGNYISALVQNAATKTAINVNAVVLQSGTTYRFTCTSAHTFAVGDAVWLQGFASSSGFFQSSSSGNVLVTNVSDSTHFDADLGASTTFTDQVGTAKGICKYGVLFQKESAGAFVQGNELHINFQGKGANQNDGEFYYAVGFLNESGADITAFSRFAGNRVYANAANATRFSNLEATWGSISDADKVFVDAWEYHQDTSTPMAWRTKAWGKSGSSAGPTWAINHGLAGLPTHVSVTPTADPGARYYVSSVTATQIVITAISGTATVAWYWKAEM